jgi:UDP-N-acetyl-D-mannosaminuronic acid dehydrogenase
MGPQERLVVVGGCGHVGLPLALLAAARGRPTTIYDIDRAALETVRAGKMPFLERGADELLPRVLASGLLELSDRPECVAQAGVIVLVVGTPVDEHLHPRVEAPFQALEPCLPHLRAGQLLILRSTVFPGMSRKVQEHLQRRGLDVDVAFCPERVAQGHTLEELQRLPQIVSAFSPRGLAGAREFFAPIAPRTLELEPLEAELAKLFTNSYRYLQFAIVNQFYMIAEAEGADYARIQAAIAADYPRLQHMPGPGLAAGPCLLKDTMQLAAFTQHRFSLGLAAVWINEGLPDFLVEQLKRQRPALRDETVGILGMAFKAESDDVRDSLSYRLKKLLQLEARRVLCTDPLVRDPGLVPLEQVLREAQVLVVGAPHAAYRGLVPPAGAHVVDVWGCLGAPG